MTDPISPSTAAGDDAAEIKALLDSAKDDMDVIGRLGRAGKREYALFLGAGCSISSGIISGEGLVKKWLPDYKRLHRLEDPEVEAWLKTQPNAYSALFEDLFDDAKDRQQYLVPLIEAGSPSWGYLYLATLIAQKDRFNVIFTTNFDDLVNESLTEFASYTPVVCAADSQVHTISVMTDRAKVIKLHGDYLFEHLKNTESELLRLDPNMDAKFRQFASLCGLVVLGYSGGDRSIMDVLDSLLESETNFPRNIWWGVRRGTTTLGRHVVSLARRHPGRFRLFMFDGFDEFMANLHEACGCELPPQITTPYSAHRESLLKLQAKLPEQCANAPTAHTYILKHSEVLQQALDSPMAKASGLNDMALLQAQLALGRRDADNAVKYAEDYLQSHPHHVGALTTLGDALELLGETLSSPEQKLRAERCWLEAIELDPGYLAPRQRLMRLYRSMLRFPDAISQAESIAAAAPDDRMTRQLLAGLYIESGRLKEAQPLIDSLLGETPDNAELQLMRGGVLQQRGLIPEALEAYRKAVSLMPSNARLHFQYANALASVGRMDEAGNEFQQAIHLEPGNLAFRFQIVTYYWSLQKPILALPHAEEAARLEPDSREALGWLGQIHMGLGDLQKAWDATEKAIALSPDDSRLLVNAGQILVNLNRCQEAEAHLRKACEKNPGMAMAYIHLCQLLRMQGRMQEANQEFFKLQQVNPQAAQMLQMQSMQPPQNVWGQHPSHAPHKPQDFWSRLFGQ